MSPPIYLVGRKVTLAHVSSKTERERELCCVLRAQLTVGESRAQSVDATVLVEIGCSVTCLFCLLFLTSSGSNRGKLPGRVAMCCHPHQCFFPPCLWRNGPLQLHRTSSSFSLLAVVIFSWSLLSWTSFGRALVFSDSKIDGPTVLLILYYIRAVYPGRGQEGGGGEG